jgi:hypothetical protein
MHADKGPWGPARVVPCRHYLLFRSVIHSEIVLFHGICTNTSYTQTDSAVESLGMAKCYDRYNNQLTSLIPCSEDGSLTHCCAPGEACASDGFCVDYGSSASITPYSIHGCTEPGWQDGSVPGCPSNCPLCK